MPDYKRMYALLCAAASEALDALPDTAENGPGRAALQKALYDTEELYVASADTETEAVG